MTSTDGTSNPIVWAYGHGTNQRLFGYNGETGALIFAGGGANDTISGTRTFNTGIAARGRIYIAGDNKVYAFSVPTGANADTNCHCHSYANRDSSTPTATATATRYRHGYTNCDSYRCAFGYTDHARRPATPRQLRLRLHQPRQPRLHLRRRQPQRPRLHRPGTPTPAAQALNLSTRMRVQTGDNVGIGGFIITGSAPKQVLLRAIGPSLTGFGVPDALADPVLELHGPAGFATITNDNWRDTQDAAIKAPASRPPMIWSQRSVRP